MVRLPYQRGTGAAIKVTRWPKGRSIWVERFGLDLSSGLGLDAFAAGFALAALGPSFCWDDGLRLILFPTSSGTRSTLIR